MEEDFKKSQPAAPIFLFVPLLNLKVPLTVGWYTDMFLGFVSGLCAGGHGVVTAWGGGSHYDVYVRRVV